MADEMRDEGDDAEVLTPVEEAKLRAAGFVATSWFHPVTKMLVEDAYRTSPRFEVEANGRSIADRMTVDEVVALNAKELERVD